MASETAFYYKEFLIVLGVAGLAVPLFLRLGVNAVVAFLVMGVLLSQDVLGNLVHAVPVLQNLNISNPENLSHIAELGVVFLLFLIGIELSFERLNMMRRLVFGLGGLQVVLSLSAIAGAAMALGFDMRGCGDSEGEKGRIICLDQVEDTKSALTYMQSRPEVDPDRTALTGISWGGYLTCITAGVEQREASPIPRSRNHIRDPVRDHRFWLDQR